MWPSHLFCWLLKVSIISLFVNHLQYLFIYRVLGPRYFHHTSPYQYSVVITGRPARSAAMPVLFLLGGPKWGFRPAGATLCPDKREIWHRPRPRVIFHVYRGRQKCETTASKTVKISNFCDIFAPQRLLLCTVFLNKIFSFRTRLWLDFKFLIWSLSGDNQPSYNHLRAVGAFSHKFSIAPSGETSDRIKKVRGCKNGTDLLYHHARYGGDRRSLASSRRKSVIFLSVCLSVSLTKFVITETLWSSVIFKTVMVSLHRGRFVVVHLYSTFSVDPRIFHYGQIYIKIYHFSRFWGL